MSKQTEDKDGARFAKRLTNEKHNIPPLML